MPSSPHCLRLMLLVVALPFAGCVSDPFNARSPEAKILSEASATSEVLAKGLKGRLAAIENTKRVDHPEMLLVASLVDVNNVSTSSPFGRMFSEQMAAEFTRRGLVVTEAKFAESFRIGNPTANARAAGKGWDEGEFALSRNVRDLAEQRGATAVIAGTYAVGVEEVLVTVRALDAKSGRIVAARNFTVPYSDELFKGGRLLK